LLHEKFEDDLLWVHRTTGLVYILTLPSALRIDAFSGIRSSIVGQLMEASYRKCNHESGSFKIIITCIAVFHTDVAWQAAGAINDVKLS
jgi:hypothetical protein